MKYYVKPELHSVTLRSEEKFASGSTGCSVYGCCFPDTSGYFDDQIPPIWHVATYFE